MSQEKKNIIEHIISLLVQENQITPIEQLMMLETLKKE
ncbi:hypothetical protein C809_02502 [Lachnospiraceae bacterium MD335]|jgi:hypothetical protein|nr:hypothetical protein C809_02502 [Lachnospiraceae bacterium MD335]